MRFIRSRSTACLASLAYLLACALGGLLHTHAHEHGPRRHDAHSESCLAAAGHAFALDRHASETPDEEGDSPSPEPLSDDGCLACRFAAQAALVSTPAPELRWGDLVLTAPASAPIFFIEPVRPGGLARAPPTC